MTGRLVEFRVIAGLDPGADEADLENESLQLRDELLELGVGEVRQQPGDPAPAGTRGAEAVLVGTLIVTVGQEAVRAVVGAVAEWLSRGRGRAVKLQFGDDAIELTDVSARDQRRMLEAFLARHADPAA